MKKNIIILSVLIMTLMINMSQVSYAETLAVPNAHWFHNTYMKMDELGLIDPSSDFKLGSPVTEKMLIKLLRTAMPTLESATALDSYDSTNPLTRQQALIRIFEEMDLFDMSKIMKSLTSPFVDTTGYQALYNMAESFGWISINSTKTFRPNANIKMEEAYSLIYNIYLKETSELELLHSYYAISSYSQIQYLDALDTVSFGWSRLELDSNTNSIVLNTTVSNANEYNVPSGYSIPIEKADSASVSKQLMVFVKDHALAEEILSNSTYGKQAIDHVIQFLTDNKYQLQFEGVLMDFEGLKGTDNAENYNTFLTLLKSRLNELNLKLTVAVHPKGLLSTGYYDGYDYNTIGNLADYVVLMAHDYAARKLTPYEMSIGYTVTPLTPINEIYYALQNILDPETGVEDSKKVLLQFSMDAVEWKLTNNQVINSIPYRPTYKSIANLIELGATQNYSKALHSPWLTQTDEATQQKSIIWYENRDSIQAKIHMAKRFELGGLSVWRLGNIPNDALYEQNALDIWQTFLDNVQNKEIQ